MKRAYETTIKNLYCYSDNSVIYYSKIDLQTKLMYGDTGNLKEALNAQRKNIIIERNKLDAMQKVVENAISSLNQGNLF